MRRIDLDQNATVPLEPEVQDVMVEALHAFPGNASALHREGRRAREVVEKARASVAQLLGALPEEILFTSGGTEANNLALGGSLPPGRGSLVISTIEHPSVARTAAAMERNGTMVCRVEPTLGGAVTLDAVLAGVDGSADLVSLMLANHETGSLQPVEEAATRLSEHPIRFHTDAVQAAGKIELDVGRLNVDLLTVSAHKIGGPKGVGCLYARNGRFPTPQILGGGQEFGVRAGTENVAGIVGFGCAAELAADRVAVYADRVGRLRDRFEREIAARFPGVVIVGSDSVRIANTSCIAFEGIEGMTLVQLLDLKGVAASTGAACETLSEDYSSVLHALRLHPALARGAVRFSLGYHTDEEDITIAVDRVLEAVTELTEL